MDKPLYNGSVLWIILIFGLCIYFLRQDREEFFDKKILGEINFKNLIILILVSRILFYFFSWWFMIGFFIFKYIAGQSQAGSGVAPNSGFSPVLDPDGKDMYK